MSAYKDLEGLFARLFALRDAEGLLHWDRATMMPPGGAEARGEEIAALKAVQHGLLTAGTTGELLDRARGESGLDEWQQANLREMKRLWTHASAVPESLVQALAIAGAACEVGWRWAHQESDFQSVIPLVQEVLDLTRESAETKAQTLDCTPYEALLDENSPGVSSAEIERLFIDLGEFLPAFLSQVIERQAGMDAPLAPPGPFDTVAQRALGEKLMGALSFDFHHGRLDESMHPFSAGTPEDLRITTRYGEEDFAPSLMGVLHETGHALYERGLPPQWRRQPVGQALGMDIHESQSLLMEMQVCRSCQFLAFAAPLMREAFAGTGPAWEPENLYQLQTIVRPGFIRVDADEITYPAHIILRHDLERALIAGDLALGDLPGAWNDGMEKLLGIRPANDREGCLQDIHWFDGAWGYRPSYTLGALAAAQMFEAARKENPDILTSIEAGKFKPLMCWLDDNVHGLGSLLPADDLIRRATGKSLGTEAFKRHLK
ncbi:MAG: carboxypeptidase M32, partial [Rhodospirillales bacterium]|nr:carboxypeptidase M32 [Rhodospirillales bacterium]